MKQILCLLLVLPLYLIGCNKKSTYENIEEKEFTKLAKKENVIILDVRTPEEFHQGHLENSRLMNYKSNTFETEANKLDTSNTYLLYCRSGGRSAKASELLSSKGFKVYNLKGGITQWKGKIIQ